MILDDKVLMRPLIPPPAYYHPSQSSPSLHTISSPSKLNLSTLPPHILLQILHHTFPQSSSNPDQGTPELQRKTLYWLSTSSRLVNRALYTACMHILRSTYLRAYLALIRPPYTSDPFPVLSGPPAYYEPGNSPTTAHQYPCQTIPESEESPLQTIQRETIILDRFITLKVREDVFSDDSSLHLEGDDKFRDLFNMAQPQARLEDLVRVYGIREGVISIPGSMAGPIAGRSMYTSSLSSFSQASFQPPASPFHDSNAVTVTYPALTHIPAPIPQIATAPDASKPRSTGFFSTIKKLASGYSPSPSSPLSPTYLSPLSPSSPSLSKSYHAASKSPPIQPLPFSSLSITFTFQSARLIQKSREDGSRKCVAEIPRSRGGRKEALEVLAEALVRALREGLEERSIGV